VGTITMDARAIERALGRAIDRRTVEGFDYKAPIESRLEAPGRGQAPRHRRVNGSLRRFSPR